ncbi:hypothetical protein GCM10027347_46790 [Larkinella harenae]
MKQLFFSFLLLGTLAACQKADQAVTPKAHSSARTGISTSSIDVDPALLKPVPSSTHGVMALFSYGNDGVPFPIQCYVDGTYVGTLKRAWKGSKAGERFSRNAPPSEKTIWVALTPGQHTVTFHFPDGQCKYYRGQFSYAKPFEYTNGLDIWMMILSPCE